METTEARAKAGWYPAESMPGMLRYWNGDAWVPEVAPRKAPVGVRKPDSPVGYIIGGFFIALLGGGLATAGASESAGLAFVGFVILGIGSIMSTIGVIAAGVRLGMEWADFERWQRDPLG